MEGRLGNQPLEWSVLSAHVLFCCLDIVGTPDPYVNRGRPCLGQDKGRETLKIKVVLLIPYIDALCSRPLGSLARALEEGE